jgi:recombination protein RecR
MKFPSKVLEETVNAIASLPGIGKKTALRLALHLTQDDKGKIDALVKSLQKLSTEIKRCTKCQMLSDSLVCDICNTSSRDNGIVCVVETIRDVMAIEDTEQFHGRYHILGGVISPLEGVGPEQLHIDSLVERVKNEDIKEIIMAVSPTIEGDTTIYYISKKLSDLNVSISTIARGVAFGGDLEYADEFTLGKSISARMPYLAR